MDTQAYRSSYARRLKLGLYRCAWPLVRRALLRRRGMSLVAFAATCLRPGDVVLDVGANSGYFTRVFAAAVRPNGRVYAFEPNPRFDDELRRASDEYSGIVAAVRAALSDRTGTASFFLDSRPEGYASTLNKGLTPAWSKAPPVTIEVACGTLDKFCDEQSLSPTLIKMDVEGSESAVIAGGLTTLRRAKPVLWLECSPDAGVAHLARLEELGYACFLGCVLARDGEWLARSDVRNPRCLLPLDVASLGGVSAVLDIAVIPRERIGEFKAIMGSQSAREFLSAQTGKMELQ